MLEAFSKFQIGLQNKGSEYFAMRLSLDAFDLLIDDFIIHQSELYSLKHSQHNL